MNNLKLEVSHVYETRDGSRVRIICTDRRSSGDCPVIGLLDVDELLETVHNYTPDGLCAETRGINNIDLVREVQP